jgi:hypothetical protein
VCSDSTFGGRRHVERDLPPQKRFYTMVICLERMDSVFSMLSETF